MSLEVCADETIVWGVRSFAGSGFRVCGGGACESSGAGQMGVFYANVGWIAGAAAQAAGDAIIAGVRTFDDARAYDKDGIADWVEASTGDGDIDCLVMFGYLPETIYQPGNAQVDDSLVEEFLDDGNFVINTADYIFYVTVGGGANGDNGLKTVTDSNFDLWTDGNAIEPTADGEKYTPSLGNFTSNRSFKQAQVDADANWEAEVAFGKGPLGYDPVVLRHVETGGRVAIWMQVANDGLNRGEVALEIFNNWASEAILPQAVDPQGKASALWGGLKEGSASR